MSFDTATSGAGPSKRVENGSTAVVGGAALGSGEELHRSLRFAHPIGDRRVDVRRL
jgi:hypothetical protein